MAGTLSDIYTYNFNGITIPWNKDYPNIDWDFQFLSPKTVQETIKFYYPNKWGEDGGAINDGKLSLKLKNGSSISDITTFTANQAEDSDFIIESGTNISINKSDNKITINADNTEYEFEQVDNTLKAGIAGETKTDIYTPVLTKGDKGDAANWFTGTTTPTSITGSLNGDMYLDTDDYNVYRREDVGTTETWVYKCNIKGAPGADGIDGQDGTDGTDGVGISSITKTGTSELVDTYTITYTNGNSTTFTVTNGQNGTDGVTPTILAASGAHIGDVGTPSVTATTVGTTTTFTFDYLKGASGSGGDGATLVNYYNTECGANNEGMLISDITKKFLKVDLGNGRVHTHSLSDISMSTDTAHSLMMGDIKSVVMRVYGERGFINNEDIIEFMPANVIYDNYDTNSCLLIGQGYKAQFARVDNNAGTAVNQTIGSGSYGNGLSPVLYCLYIFFDDVEEVYEFSGFVIYPFNFGLFGTAGTL